MSSESENERIDLTQFEGIMNIEWLFDEQLFVGEQKRWRFDISEYTDIELMSEKEYEEWEDGLESVWDSLTSGVAHLPKLIAELKRCYEKIDKMNEAILSARELLMSYFDAVTLSDDEAAQEILDVVKELRKTSE